LSAYPIRDVTDETTWYLVNRPGGPCVSIDQQANLRGIYEPRPLMCRLFGCQGEFRDELVELGILPPRDFAKR
jgi:Fe-S-cluster containining protein